MAAGSPALTAVFGSLALGGVYQDEPVRLPLITERGFTAAPRLTLALRRRGR